MLKDRYVQEAMALFKSITVALVGIGAVTPSKMLAASGNVFSAKELKSLSDRGAVGDICLRFFDAQRRAGRHAAERTRHRHRARRSEARRSGGRHRRRRRKFAAIRGALRGRRINVLITDRSTAERWSRARRRRHGRRRETAATADALRESRE